MFRYLLKKRGQTTLEYAILIGVIVAALIAMQVYLKRGFQGKIRDSADNMGDQYSPGFTTSHEVTQSASDTNENVGAGITTTTIRAQTTDKNKQEQVATFDNEYWWE